MTTLTIVGLGPGLPDFLTRASVNALDRASILLAEPPLHPVLQLLAERGIPIEVLHREDSDEDQSNATDRVAMTLLSRARELDRTVLAVPGNPLEDDPLARAAYRLGFTENTTLIVIPGVSLTSVALAALGPDIASRDIRAVREWDLEGSVNLNTTKSEPDPFQGIYRRIDPTRPVLAGPFRRAADLTRLDSLLGPELPTGHQLLLVRLPVDGASPITELSAVGRLGALAATSDTLFVYAGPIDRLDDLPSFDTLQYIVARLRAPGGCPWDREQTYQSIKKHLIEETYEAIAALDSNDSESLAEELGDILLQVVMYSQLGREAGDFTIDDVLRFVNAKLIRRHPHVFGGVEVAGSAEVLRNWERIKRGERKAELSSFAGIPDAAPALIRAAQIVSRSERYGFPPSALNAEDGEESSREAEETDRLRNLGNQLLTLVVEARSFHLDPEEALRLATNRIRDGFNRVLLDYQAQGVDFASQPLEERLTIARAAVNARRQ